MAVDERTFRLALGHFPTGVSIVTMLDARGKPQGLTANSFTSVSLDPPLVLVNVEKTIASYPAMKEASGWLFNVLADNQEELSRRFATPDIDKFAGISIKAGPYGAPRIPGALAYIAARPWARYDGGDHDIFVGEVTEAEWREGDPLVFYKGNYGIPDAVRIPSS